MGIQNPTLVEIRDEGVSQGPVTALNFTGAGVTASTSGFVGTVNVPGGGGGSSATEIEIDLGSTLRTSGRFTITDAAIDSTSKVLVWQAPGPYTGKGTLADEAALQPVRIVAVEAGTGEAVVYWETPPMTGFKADALIQFLNSGAGAINYPKDPFATVSGPMIRLGKIRGNVKFLYMVLT